MFIHLRLHSEFSIVDSTLQVAEAIKLAIKNDQPALALTDFNNLFGAIQFYKTALAKGIKPIIGADIAVAENSGAKFNHLLLLAKDNVGYHNLTELLTKAWLNEDIINHAYIKPAWLAQHNQGLIVLSGAIHGAIGKALLADDWSQAVSLASQYQQLYPNCFYLEVQRVGRREDASLVEKTVKLAQQLNLPLVATQPIQFAEQSDFTAHEVRVCISTGEILANPKRPKNYTSEQYFKSSQQMQQLFADLPSAIANTTEIAQRCNLSIELGRPQLPNYPIAQGLSEEEYFRQTVQQGLEQRLAKIFPTETQRNQQREKYQQRLEFEINTILAMGFPGYFLIVSDFINWAKNNACPVGPGRGSGAGSLVAYALKITDLDPLQYNLLFERFLNPERVSMPDFDIDFCQTNRDRVIDYVKAKYGYEAVSQIATFGTMAARAAIRDVGRVLDFNYNFCDGVSKLIPNKPGQAVTLQYPPLERPANDKHNYAIEMEPQLKQRIESEEDVRTLIEMAQKLEGLTRNIGMHAGGVLIAPSKLTDFCPLYRQIGSDSAISQFAKDDVEAVGLVKFDFLGLATLTILNIASNLIRQRYPEQANFQLESIPLDDKLTFELFSQGRTEAVFQFESQGMQNLLKEAKPSKLEDLIALNALYRPGPMDLIPSFVARKHGRETVEYPHPLVATVLTETYGIMVYQEQVMQTAQILGGYSLGGADLLRRAMGKKKVEEMAKHRQIFQNGAAEKGITAQKAGEIFDLMEKFAGYGFNKSHAAAYSLLAYQTAWLKVHFPVEFFCANMIVEMDNTDKLKALYDDALDFGLSFEAPNINRGGYIFEPAGTKSIRYGMGAIKGTGEQAIEAVVQARNGQGKGEFGQQSGEFSSIFNFCKRVERSKINKRTVEALIKAGAFDSLNNDRAALLASVDTAFTYAAEQEKNAHQGGLFDFADDAIGSSNQEPPLVGATTWTNKQRLIEEKSVIGFLLTGNLFDDYLAETEQLGINQLAKLTAPCEPITVAGIITSLRSINTGRGKLTFLVLDNAQSHIEMIVDEQQLIQHQQQLALDELLVVEAQVKKISFSNSNRVMVKEISNLVEQRVKKASHLEIHIQQEDYPLQQMLHQLEQQSNQLSPNAAKLPIKLRIERHGAKGICLLQKITFVPTDKNLAICQKITNGNSRLVFPR